MNQPQQYRNVILLSDRSGTGKWRRTWPMQLVDCHSQGEGIQADYTQYPVLQPEYYKGITSITIQRWISDYQKNIVDKLLKPICDANSAWLIYEIDDNMSDKHIPLFNRGRQAFEGEHIQSNIKSMLNSSDLVTVTTDYIKDFYNKEYGVPLENIVAIPNLLPKYLFGDRYEVDKKLDQFRKYKLKPRIGIVSSLSHYNIDDVRQDSVGKAVRKKKSKDGTSDVWVNEAGKEIPESETNVITDDLDEIISCIRETANDVQWVFFGFCPPKLNDLAKDKKIEVHGGVPIMNYASVFERLQLQAIVAPIKDMEFNRCKSFIKYMEAAALGVPLFASNYLPYSRVMPSSQLFNDGKQLKDMLMKLKFASAHVYKDIVERQWSWLNSPCHEGDFDLKNFWLEDNIGIWLSLFKLRQKTLSISMQSFEAQYQAKKQKESSDLIFKNERGITITR